MKNQNTNESETPAAVAGAAPCSAVWNGQLLAHPFHMAIYELMGEIEKLPASEQDALAALVLEELASEERWSASFAESQDLLASLAEEALAEHAAGQTKPL